MIYLYLFSCLVLSRALFPCLCAYLVFPLTSFLILVYLFSSWLCLLVFNLVFLFCLLPCLLVFLSLFFFDCVAFCHILIFLFLFFPVFFYYVVSVLGLTFVHDLLVFCLASYFDEIVTQNAWDKYRTNFTVYTGKWLCKIVQIIWNFVCMRITWSLARCKCNLAFHHLKLYNSTTTMPIATKLGRMGTYFEVLPSIKSHELLIVISCDESKTCLHHHKTYGNRGCDYPWRASNHKIKWLFGHMVLQSHMTKWICH